MALVTSAILQQGLPCESLNQKIYPLKGAPFYMHCGKDFLDLHKRVNGDANMRVFSTAAGSGALAKHWRP